MVWKADTVQAALFTLPGSAQPDALNLWATLDIGKGPDNFQKNGEGLNSSTMAAGKLNGYALTVTSQLGRVDLVLNNASPAPDPSSGPPQLDDYKNASSSVVDLACKISKSLPLNRAALVISLSESVSNFDEARKILGNLKNVKFPEDSYDCIYQYNMRRAFTSIPNVQMNRISTWLMGEFQLVSLTPGAATPFRATMRPFVQYKIDVNNVPVRGLSPSIVEAVWKELDAEAMSLAQHPWGLS